MIELTSLLDRARRTCTQAIHADHVIGFEQDLTGQMVVVWILLYAKSLIHGGQALPMARMLHGGGRERRIGDPLRR